MGIKGVQSGTFWLGVAGVALILGGIVSILAANWATIPFGLQVTLALLPLGILLPAVWKYSRTTVSREDVEEVLGTAWAGSVVCAVALLARVLQLPSDGFAFCVTMIVLLSAVTWRLRSVAALFLQVIFLFALCAGDIPERFAISEDLKRFVVLGIGGSFVAPRMLTCFRLSGCRGWWVRWIATGVVLFYFEILLLLLAEILGVRPLGVLVLGNSLLQVLWMWLEQGENACQKSLTFCGTLTVGFLLLGARFDLPDGWPYGIAFMVVLLLLYRWVLFSNAMVLLLVPLTLCFGHLGVTGDCIVLFGSMILLFVGLMRGSRYIANSALVYLLVMSFLLFENYAAKLMLTGVIFVIGGSLLLVLNCMFARLRTWVCQRFHAMNQDVALPEIGIFPKPLCSRIRKGLLIGSLLIAVLQVIVPGWLLLKYVLVMTYGEVFPVAVTVGDPRDLLAGKYVQLTPNALPEALKDLPRDYLRYYCDERYAARIEDAVAQGAHFAQLNVRLWRGTALAEALLIEGMPAYDYIMQEEVKINRTAHHAIRMRLSLQALAEISSFCSPRDICKDEMSTYFPNFSGLNGVWSAVLANLNMPYHANDLPHPIWMDLWLADADLPPEAFVPQTMRQQNDHLFDAYDFDKNVLLPAFTGVPKTLPRGTHSFAEVAAVYYRILKESANWRFKDRYFTVKPPQNAAEAKAIFEGMCAAATSEWFIFAEDGGLPEGFPWDLPQERIVVISPLPPPEGVAWVKMVPSRSALEPLPKRCVGWMLNGPVRDRSGEILRKQQLGCDSSSFVPQMKTLWERIASPETDLQCAENLATLKALLCLMADYLETVCPHRQSAEVQADIQQVEAWLALSEKAAYYADAEDVESYQQWHFRRYGFRAELSDLPIRNTWCQQVALSKLAAMIERIVACEEGQQPEI